MKIWKLGNHRLACGDATKQEDINKLMDGHKAVLCFTDPPYGMGKESAGIANDNLYRDRLLDFNRAWIPLSFDALTDNGSWYCWGFDEALFQIYADILKPMQDRKEILFRNFITWYKRDVPGQNWDKMTCYAPATERALFFMKGPQKIVDVYYEPYEPIRQYLVQETEKILNGRSPTRALEEVLGSYMGHHYLSKSQWAFPVESAYKKLQEAGRERDAFTRPYSELKAEYQAIKQHKDMNVRIGSYFDNTHDQMTDVWTYANATEYFKEFQAEKADGGNHPTVKPQFICQRGIKSSSQPGDIVLDLFAGSGSTLIACEHTGRRCYALELSEHWCEVIVQRWERLTGQKAVLLER